MKGKRPKTHRPPAIEYQDILYFYAAKGELSYTEEPLPGVYVKYDPQGKILVIEVFNASQRLWPFIEGVLATLVAQKAAGEAQSPSEIPSS